MTDKVEANTDNQWAMVLEAFTSMHEDVTLLTTAIAELRADMHHPPCDIMKNHITNHGTDVTELRKELIEHKKIHEEIGKAKSLERIGNKKFVRNIETIVIAAVLISILGGVCGLIYTGFIQETKTAAEK